MKIIKVRGQEPCGQQLETTQILDDNSYNILLRFIESLKIKDKTDECEENGNFIQGNDGWRDNIKVLHSQFPEFTEDEINTIQDFCPDDYHWRLNRITEIYSLETGKEIELYNNDYFN